MTALRNHCDHHHEPQMPTDLGGISARLEAAEVLCSDSGERMTASRRRTFEMILRASGPIKAYELIDHFHDHGAAKPPTVYRALSFLEQMGLIHRIESLNAFVACRAEPSMVTEHRAAFLLCTCCGRSEEFALNDVSPLTTAANRRKFQIERITIEVRGRCQACA